MCVEHPSQAVDRLLETIDVSSVFLASLVGKSLPFLPSYVLLPAIGMRESGAVDLVLRFVSTTASVSAGLISAYLVGTRIGIQWFSQLDDRNASVAEDTDTAKGRLAREVDQ